MELRIGQNGSSEQSLFQEMKRGKRLFRDDKVFLSLVLGLDEVSQRGGETAEILDESSIVGHFPMKVRISLTLFGSGQSFMTRM